MYCSKCGTANIDTAQFCVACAQPLLLPPGTPPPPRPVGATPPVPLGEAQTSGKAIASLVCGLLSFVFPAAIAAVILGHISRSEIRKSGGRLQGSGLALTGLIFGYMGIALIPILIIAAIAIPNLLRARIAANESSAVATIRSINVAQSSYHTAHPDLGYACSLRDLGKNESSPSGLLDDTIARGQRNGYIFNVENCSADSYAVSATPISRNQTGTRSFCSKEDAVIHVSNSSAGECLENGDPL